MQQQLTQYNQTDVTRRVQEPPSLAGLTKNRMIDKYGMTEQESRYSEIGDQEDVDVMAVYRSIGSAIRKIKKLFD